MVKEGVEESNQIMDADSAVLGHPGASEAQGQARVMAFDLEVSDQNCPGMQGSTDERGNVLAYTISDEERLMRFLVLGSEGGTFYATEKDLREQNAQAVTRLIRDGQGQQVVERVVEVVTNGRAIRINSALFTLALCCRSEDMRTKTSAYRAVQQVCNIPTHLFIFIEYMESAGKTTGWGRGLRNAVSRWFNQFAINPERLAMLVTKYRQRQGWSHRDLLRLSHSTPVNDVIGFILRYSVKGLEEAKRYYLGDDGYMNYKNSRMKFIVKYLEAVEEVRYLESPAPQKKEEKARKGDIVMKDVTAAGEEEMKITEDREVQREQAKFMEDRVVKRVVTLIQEFRLLWEHLPTFLLNYKEVWKSLLEEMPIMALMRNLNKMTCIGMLDEEDSLNKVLEKLNNKEAIMMSKVHPVSVLVSWFTYKTGKGMKGNLKWVPKPQVVTALERAFYAAFGNVEPTHKRILIAVDVSLSMDIRFSLPTITARVAAAVMSMVTLKTETAVDIVAFSEQLTVVNAQKDWSLDKVVEHFRQIPMGGTDCSLPMLWAAETGREYDAFIIYTDCETWYSQIRPADALRKYRQASGIHNARLAVVGLTSGGFTLADPQDLYMMDFVGFDTETPRAMQQFITGAFCE